MRSGVFMPQGEAVRSRGQAPCSADPRRNARDPGQAVLSASHQVLVDEHVACLRIDGAVSCTDLDSRAVVGNTSTLGNEIRNVPKVFRNHSLKKKNASASLLALLLSIGE